MFNKKQKTKTKDTGLRRSGVIAIAALQKDAARSDGAATWRCGGQDDREQPSPQKTRSAKT